MGIEALPPIEPRTNDIEIYTEFDLVKGVLVFNDPSVLNANVMGQDGSVLGHILSQGTYDCDWRDVIVAGHEPVAIRQTHGFPEVFYIKDEGIK